MYHASYVIKLIFLRSTVQNFSFVMNDEHAVRSFGFCRTAPNADTALVSCQELGQFANRASRFCPSGHDVESSVARGVLQVAQPRGRAPSVFRRRRTRTLPRRLLQCTGENVYFNEETNSRQLITNQSQVPLGGAPFHVSWNFPPSPGGDPTSPRKRDFSCQTPTSHALPSIPENVSGLS